MPKMRIYSHVEPVVSELPSALTRWMYQAATGPLTVAYIVCLMLEWESWWSLNFKTRFPHKKVLKRFVRNVETFGSKGARFSMEIYLAGLER